MGTLLQKGQTLSQELLDPPKGWPTRTHMRPIFDRTVIAWLAAYVLTFGAAAGMWVATRSHLAAVVGIFALILTAAELHRAWRYQHTEPAIVATRRRSRATRPRLLAVWPDRRRPHE